MGIMKAQNSTVYDVVQLNTDEDEAIAAEWLSPLVESDDVIDLSEVRKLHLYVLRHPKAGAVTFVHPGDYLIDFEELTPLGADGTPTSQLTEAEVDAFAATLSATDNKNSEQQPE